MIKSVHDQKIDQKKNCRPKTAKVTKLIGQAQILVELEKGKYASQIAKSFSFSRTEVYKAIKKFKHLGYIKRKMVSLPYNSKIYEITEKGRYFLNTISLPSIGQFGHTSEKKIENIIEDKKIRPNKIRKISIHKLRFKQELINKPSWLYQINATNSQYRGFVVKRIHMNNWDKFILYHKDTDKDTFGGIHNIEVCNNYVIYNFRRSREDSVVSTVKGLQNFLDERIADCKQIKILLESKGFQIGPRDPVPAQKHHFVIETDDGFHTKEIGKYVELHIKNKDTGATLIFDDSDPEGGGEMEVDEQEDAETILDEAKNIQEIKDDVDDIKGEVKGLKEQISELVSAIGTLVKAIKPEQPQQTIERRPPSGGGQYI